MHLTIKQPKRFGVQKSKERTARISLWKEFQIPAIFTMEASFCGCDEGKLDGVHFTGKHLKQIGRDLCRTLISYCEISSSLMRELSDSEEEKKQEPIEHTEINLSKSKNKPRTNKTL